jgi:hypothetical protein
MGYLHAWGRFQGFKVVNIDSYIPQLIMLHMLRPLLLLAGSSVQKMCRGVASPISAVGKTSLVSSWYANSRSVPIRPAKREVCGS